MQYDIVIVMEGFRDAINKIHKNPYKMPENYSTKEEDWYSRYEKGSSWQAGHDMLWTLCENPDRLGRLLQ